MTISLGPATLAECGEESLGSDFVAQLGTVEAFEYDDATLMLTLADGSTMSFAARKDM
jgi:phosphoglucomutase